MPSPKRFKLVQFKFAVCDLSAPFCKGNPKYNPFVHYTVKSASMTSWIYESLLKARMLPDPFFESLMITLSENPNNTPHLHRNKFLGVEVAYDPKDALVKGEADEVVGERFIGYLMEAMHAIRKEYTFDLGPIEDAIATYRAQDYKVWYTTAKGTLKGRTLKYEVQGGVGPNSTKIQLCIKDKSGKHKHICAGQFDQPNQMMAQGFNSIIERESGVEIIHGRSRVFDSIFVPTRDLVFED